MMPSPSGSRSGSTKGTRRWRRENGTRWRRCGSTRPSPRGTAPASSRRPGPPAPSPARRNRERSLTPLLSRLEAGEGFDAAVLATTGSPLGRFELEWQKDVRRRYGLVVWVMAGGFWTLAALVVLAAVWLRRRRDRPRRAALDEGWVVEVEGDETPPLDQDRKSTRLNSSHRT